jgi:hypothetical protein
MKIFIRLRHVWRVFLIIGIASLSIFTAVSALLLSPPPAAHAQESQGNCPTGWHIDTGNPSGCRPDGFCDSGFVMSHQDGATTCIPSTSNPNQCNPRVTWQNPDDAQQCLPIDRHCGSASYYDSTLGHCVMFDQSVQTYIQNHFDDRHCGSASYYDGTLGHCVPFDQSVQTYNFP